MIGLCVASLLEVWTLSIPQTFWFTHPYIQLSFLWPSYTASHLDSAWSLWMSELFFLSVLSQGISLTIQTGTQCFQNYYPGVHHHYRYVIPLAAVSHTLWFLLAGWVVLSGKTRVQDPRANFRNAFAGSSQSSNDVNYFLSHLPHLSYLIWHLLVCHCNVQSTRRLFRLVKCQLRPKRCQESRADPQDRRPSWAWNLRRSLYSQQYIVLRVRSPFCRIHTYCLLISWWLRSAASKQQILNSGVTVASLFFGEVFGSQAQKALTVFVALRLVGTTFGCIFCWLWLQVLLGS